MSRSTVASSGGWWHTAQGLIQGGRHAKRVTRREGARMGVIGMIYIVLGMHKSGTSLVARTLHASGVDMGEFNDSLDYEADRMMAAMGIFFTPSAYLIMPVWGKR